MDPATGRTINRRSLRCTTEIHWPSPPPAFSLHSSQDAVPQTTRHRRDIRGEHGGPNRGQRGEPDLQGVWRYEGAIPFERPAEFEGREFLTDEEVAQRDQVEKEQAANRLAGLEGADVGRRSISESPIRGNEYNSFWQNHGRPRKVYKQTSLIVGRATGACRIRRTGGRQRRLPGTAWDR